MKLKRLYCNDKSKFSDINFKPGLNVVLATVTKHNDKTRDAHNLGKTSLVRLIDFCLLKEEKKDFFIFQNPNLSKLDFYLVIDNDGGYITIKRSAKDPQKVSIAEHSDANADLLKNPNWLHEDITVKKGKEILNAYLKWTSLGVFSYRKQLEYLLRTQDAYKKIFEIHQAQSHKSWKPALAQIIGFDAGQLTDLYKHEENLEEISDSIKIFRKHFKNTELSNLEAKLEELNSRIDKKKIALENLAESKKNKIHDMVYNIDQEIAEKSSLLYRLNSHLEKIDCDLKDSVRTFDIDAVENLFNEVSLFFPEQLKKNFSTLISFNNAITAERHKYLIKNKKDLQKQIADLNSELSTLGQERQRALRFLSGTDLNKVMSYLIDDIEKTYEEISIIESSRKQQQLIIDLESEYSTLGKQYKEIVTELKQEIAEPDGTYQLVRTSFSEIITQVLSKKAQFSVNLNKQNHLDFKVDFISESGSVSQAKEGHSYSKLLCVAFDLAVLKAHLNDRYARFLFHDGVLESLDNRIKKNLIDVYRDFSNIGLQTIITVISSDLPGGEEDIHKTFKPNEIVRILDEEHRLFNCEPW